MYELSVCIEWLFAENDRPFADRIRAAAAAGVPSVEFWNWHDKDMDAVRAAATETGVVINTFCVEPAGVLLDPTTHDIFLGGLRESIELARELGTTQLVVLAGNEDPARSREEQHAAVVAGLRAGAPIAEAANITLILEPLNTLVDHPGHFLYDTAEAFEILREVDSPNVKLLYDAYHSLVMGEDPRTVLDGNVHLLGHIQIADAPGRHEPGTGTEDWNDHLATFAELGYDGYIGLEYSPLAPTEESLIRITEIAAQHGPANSDASRRISTQ